MKIMIMTSKTHIIIYIICSVLCLHACTDKQTSISTDLPAAAESIKIIEDQLGGNKIVIAGNSINKWMVAFDASLNGTIRNFEPIQAELPSIMTDQQGNVYDIFGNVIKGPESGQQLKTLNSGMGYWFAFSSVFPGIDLYMKGPIEVEFEADTSGPWSIATNVMARGAAFDAIPSLDNPKTIQYIPRASIPGEKFFLDKDDLLIWVSVNGETKAYPHKILDWHEIINDRLGGLDIAVTYHPLTGTAKVWKRNAPDNLFAVSGLIYNSNMLAYAKGTGNYWQQIQHRVVSDPPEPEEADLLPHIELSWQDLLRIDDNPFILSNETPYMNDYFESIYQEYKENEAVHYPVFLQDTRLHPKERVFCIAIGGHARVYQFSDL